MSRLSLHFCREFHDTFHIGGKFVEEIMVECLADTLKKRDVKVLFVENQITVGTVTVDALRQPSNGAFLAAKFLFD